MANLRFLPTKPLARILGGSIEYHPKRGNKEFAMSLFSRELTNEDGESFEVLLPGSTVEGSEKFKDGGAEINPSKSQPLVNGVKVPGWDRSSTIHTHHRGGSDDFSDNNGTFGSSKGGDIGWALNNNVKLYLVDSRKRIKLFDPVIYNSRVKRAKDGYIFSDNHKKAVEEATRIAKY